MRKLLAVAAALLIAAAAVYFIFGRSGGGSPADSASEQGAKPALQGPVRVGSKPDGESLLLAEIIMQTLRYHGFNAVDKSSTGGTAEVRQALRKKEIDIYPEYTSVGLTEFHKELKVDRSTLTSVTLFETVKKADDSLGVRWLWQAPANSAPCIAVNKTMASTYRLSTVADLAAYVKRGGEFKVAGAKPFFDTAGAMPTFERAYGFKLTPAQRLAMADDPTASADPGVAAANGVNAWIVYGTDPALVGTELVVLADTKEAQLASQPAPVLRTEVLDKWGEIRVWLSPVYARLDSATLRRLNKQVTVDGKDPKVVAGAWLKTMGFVK
jgi:osmoprotectant transport system substrate-binding protein